MADAIDAELLVKEPDTSKIASLLRSMKSTAENAAGSVVAAGIVALIAKLLSG